MSRTDGMAIAAFVSTSMTKSQVGAWTHASTDTRTLSSQYYVSLVQMLERNGFDFVFFDDRLAIPSAYGGSHTPSVERGARAIKLDLLILLGMLSAQTSTIGLGGTYSTTYSMPYAVARAFATLDHLSEGRALWNVVTSRNADEAANFGVDFRAAEDRYARAEEHLEIVTRLWESWGADALKIDKSSGVFADADSVRRIDYEGEFFSSAGPLSVPRTPQGWPTLLQAGQSQRGQEFAAKWADMVFTSQYDMTVAQEHYRGQKALMDAGGRDSNRTRIMPAILPIIGETDEIAREKAAYFDSLLDPIESLIFLSEQANFDFGSLPLDEPLTDELLASVSGVRGSVLGYIQAARKSFGGDATLRDIAISKAQKSGTRFVGSAHTVADRLEEWYQSNACDGFVITAANAPGSFEDFARLVVPELRRRGILLDSGSRQGTFRERMQLEERVTS